MSVYLIICELAKIYHFVMENIKYYKHAPSICEIIYCLSTKYGFNADKCLEHNYIETDLLKPFGNRYYNTA